MYLSRKIKWVMAGFALVLLAAIGGIWLLRSHMECYIVGIHQRSVTRSIREWGIECAAITNDASAVTAAGMVEYISRYYVPGPGYRGPAEIEVTLEHQRIQTLGQITDALESYTHLNYGTNAQRWGEWAESQRKRTSETNSLQDRSDTLNVSPGAH